MSTNLKSNAQVLRDIASLIADDSISDGLAIDLIVELLTEQGYAIDIP